MRDQLFGGEEGGKVSVLVVDEQYSFAELLAGELQRQGDLRTVATAENNTVATDLVSQHRPSVLVVSAMLSERGCFRLLKQLRQANNPPRCVLIDDRVCVAHIREGLRLGATALRFRRDDFRGNSPRRRG